MATFAEIKEVKRKYAAQLLKQPGVCGLDIETVPGGRAFLAIHLDSENPDFRPVLPESLHQIPVRYVQTGPIRKQSVKHTS